MSGLSERYIMQLLRNYAGTDAGKKKVTQYRQAKFNESGGAGSLSKERVDSILNGIRNDFINAVKSVITSFRGSAVRTSAGQVDDKGYIKASITVDEDALRRESLHYINQDMAIGRGKGVDDILALFSHGYTISNRPYGTWVRNPATSGGQPLVRIGALMHRDPNPFLTNFVTRMNTQHSGICEITLNDKYKQGGG